VVKVKFIPPFRLFHSTAPPLCLLSSGQHHGRPGCHGRRPRHPRGARARRRHGVPPAGCRPAAAPRRRPPPRRPHHRRPPQGIPARIWLLLNIGGGKCFDSLTHTHQCRCPLMTSPTAMNSGELRRHLGSSRPHVVCPCRRRRSGQPHLGALLTGVKHPSRAQDGDGESAEGRRAAVGAERWRGSRFVLHHLQGRVGHGRAAGAPGRHVAWG
jgi:hypothetical protein